jgi:hypothetical protein
MASSIAMPQPVAVETAREAATARRLEVPLGGHGWGWSLLSRYTILFCLHTISWVLPFEIIPRWLYAYSDLGTRYLMEHFPIFPVRDGNLRFYEHLLPLVLGAIWLLLDRKRKYEVQLQEIGRVMARYSIAGILAAYGLEKTFGAQGSHTYVTYHGYTLPYGVLWRQYAIFQWLGHSIIYENFAALVELLPLFLMPFRRTATWGALVAFAACLNVYIVNTGHWDWGLSLTPIAMIIIPIVLLIPHTKRFAQLFLGKPVEPLVVGYLTPPKWYWPVAGLAKMIFIPMTMYHHNHFVFAAGSQQWESTLGGIYRVESFTRNGKAEPFAAEYPKRWREVAIGRYVQDITVGTIDGAVYNAFVEMPQRVEARMSGGGLASDSAGARWVDSTSKPSGTITVLGMQFEGLEVEKRYDSKPEKKVFRFEHPSPGDVTLSGVFLGDTVTAQLRRVPTDTMPLYRYRWYPERWRGELAGWMRRHGVIYPY